MFTAMVLALLSLVIGLIDFPCQTRKEADAKLTPLGKDSDCIVDCRVRNLVLEGMGEFRAGSACSVFC
jgi:hypothetical protein